MAYFTTGRGVATLVAAAAMAVPAVALADPGTNNAGGQGNGTPAPQSAPAQGKTPPGQGQQSAQSTTSNGQSSTAPGHTKSTQGGTTGNTQSSRAQGNTGNSATHTSGPQSGPDQGSQTPGQLNSDCTAQKDPRDPGSCQEKGRGNSYDRDPYRGPNRGNDCDEGGGNNINGSRTNASNGDSPDDNDMGGGNNRCGTQSSNTPENPPPGTTSTPSGPGPSQAATPPTQTVAGVTETNPNGPNGPKSPNQQTIPVSANTPAVRTEVPGVAAGPRAERALPFTGLNALWMALVGLLMCGLSFAVRGIARRDAA